MFSAGSELQSAARGTLAYREGRASARARIQSPLCDVCGKVASIG